MVANSGANAHGNVCISKSFLLPGEETALDVQRRQILDGAYSGTFHIDNTATNSNYIYQILLLAVMCTITWLGA